MPRVHVDDDTLRVQIAGYGVAEDGHPVEVPEAVARDLEKSRRLPLRIERDAPKPRLAVKKAKED